MFILWLCMYLCMYVFVYVLSLQPTPLELSSWNLNHEVNMWLSENAFVFFFDIFIFLGDMPISSISTIQCIQQGKKRSNPCFDMMINYKSKGVNKLNYKKNNRQFIYFKSLFLFFNQFCIININVSLILCIRHIYLYHMKGK